MAGSQGIRAGRAFVELYANDSKLTRGLRTAQRKLMRFSAFVTSIGVKLAGLASAVAVPLMFTVKASSRMEEVMNKFNVVFGENSKVVKEWSDGFAKDVGRSQRQVAEFMAGSQDLFVPLGFDEAAATKMSKQITGLAVDLASFNNMADEDTLRDLHAALTGSGEVMKKYGVIVSEAAVKQELLNQGMDPKAATDQQKVMARLAIIMRGTTAAQGDARRSSKSYANQVKRLKAVIEDAAGAIGDALRPTLAKLAGQLADIIERVTGWIRNNQQLVKVIAITAAIVGGIGAALLAVGAAAAFVSFAIGGLVTVFGAIASPVGLAVAGVIALAVALGGLIAWGMKSGDLFKKLGRLILSVFNVIVKYLTSGPLAIAAKLLWETLKVIWLNGIADIGKTYEKLKEAWKGVTDQFTADWKSAIGEVKKDMKGLTEEASKPKKAGAKGGANAVPDGQGPGIRFDFGLWGEWFRKAMSPPVLPAEEGVIETFKLKKGDVKESEKAKPKKKPKGNPADDVPIMPLFAPGTPEVDAAKARQAELEGKLANLNTGASFKGLDDMMSGAALTGTFSTMSRFMYSQDKHDKLTKGDKFLGDKLDDIKNKLDEGGLD